MSRTVHRAEVLLAVPPRPDSAREVRRALESEGVPEDIAHTLLLLSTEIVGNAVRHAGLADDQKIVFFAPLRRGVPPRVQGVVRGRPPQRPLRPRGNRNALARRAGAPPSRRAAGRRS